ncbi:MAG: lipopolysaccharide biosynthesis protein [Ruminococcus sp.]|nr:lipopolysaccharide biosynthesis protein [Ruminococcus sp.]
MLNHMDENELNQNQLNITLKHEEQEAEGISIPVTGIFRCLKRFAIGWIVVAILTALLVAAGTATFSQQLSSAPVSLIEFNYSGAEKGLTPDGKKLDVNSIKNPTVVEMALTKMGYPLEYVESVRSAITIDGIVPEAAVDEISVYKASYEKSGGLPAAQAMLEVEYFPTQYRVTFNFANTPFGDDEAAKVINTVLECYRIYFFETYGSNNAIGNASLALDYNDYDYLVAVDTYSETLRTLQNKLTSMSHADKSQFRSTQTGFSFDDLKDSVETALAYDADTLTAYILSNSVVRDKEGMISYYEYRIEELERTKTSAVSQLNTIEESIEKYEKNAVVMFGGSEEDAASYTKASSKYDQLFIQKNEAQEQVSRYSQMIAECEAHLESVKKLGSRTTDADKVAYVEERLVQLGEKVDQLVEDVNATVMEYNESVEFANAYTVLVPASVLSTSYVSMLLQNIMKPLLLVEAIVLLGYIGISVVKAFVIAYGQKKEETEASAKA